MGYASYPEEYMDNYPQLEYIRVIRIDNDVRAKLGCQICGQETYARTSDLSLPPSIMDLIVATKGHIRH